MSRLRDMNNANAAAKSCKRCQGEGMGQHSRANGMCYLCGRMPGEGHAVAAVAPADARAKAIADISVALRKVTQWSADGELQSWLDWTDMDSNPTVGENIRATVRHAPTDVAARARAAFARLGVAV